MKGVVSKPEPTLVGPDSKADKGSTTEPNLLADLLIEVARYLNRDLSEQIPENVTVDPRYTELRRLILGREQDLLSQLKQQFEDPERFATAIANVLPAAVTQAALRDDQLSRALSPTVESAAQVSIKKDPRTLINILYPLMGPAIRKSIGERLEGNLQSLNQMLKYSLSWQGLRWRLEAYRTGATFAEVVLKHTLLYRVEHVFLIHRHTGLLIEHIAAEHAEAKDPQLVSGMLTAIQDFVRDSFSETDTGGIDTLRLGELLLWCEDGPYALLAAVIRGSPPETLHDLLGDVLVKIHGQKSQALESFDGDTAPFADIRDLLAECLRSQEKPHGKKTWALHWLFYLLPVTLLSLGGYWYYQRHQDHRRFMDYIQRLQIEPGIVVTGFEKHDAFWHVTGLRDPLATDPKELVADASLDPELVLGHWELYQALHPVLVLKRIQGSLDPVSTVSFTLEKDTILAHGTAPHVWIQKARTLSRTLPPGSPALDLSAVKDAEMTEFERLRDVIQSHLLYFDYNIPKPAPGQEATIETLAAELRELAELARRSSLPVRVTVTGHADSTGKDTPNLALSVGRAEVVRSLLRAKGVDADLLSVRGAGPLEPLQTEVSESDRSRNRRVSFTVSIVE